MAQPLKISMPVIRKASRAPVLSRHTAAGSSHWSIEAHYLNQWCRIPGTPFAEGFFLQPNRIGVRPVSVTFTQTELTQNIDTLTLFLNGRAREEESNLARVDVEIIHEHQGCLVQARVWVSPAEEKVLTLRFSPQEMNTIRFRYNISYDEFAKALPHCGVSISYSLAYTRNSLVELFNRMGSDKGTESRGGKGVPHCYAIDYFHLFQCFREEPLSFLEIGLDMPSARTGRPQDAPSLRAWREFFPQATIYGYDINDFSFFKQEGTFTFQGDQSSRADIRRFLDVFDKPQFRVILDDGSHASSHQQISLGALFPYVEPGGMYLIEDLFWQPFEETPKTLEVINQFTKSGTFLSPFIEKGEVRYLEENIEKIEIYKPNDSEFAVIYKK
jgi:hypothetical protein